MSSPAGPAKAPRGRPETDWNSIPRTRLFSKKIRTRGLVGKEVGSGGRKRRRNAGEGRKMEKKRGGREKKVGVVQWPSLGTTTFSLIHWPSFTMPTFENFENSIAGVVNAGL